MKGRVTLEFNLNEATIVAKDIVNPKHPHREELISYIAHKIIDDYTESTNLVKLHNGIKIDATTDILNTLREADLQLFIGSNSFTWSVDKDKTAEEMDVFFVNDHFCLPADVLQVNKYKESYNVHVRYRVVKDGKHVSETQSVTLLDLYVVDAGQPITVRDFINFDHD